MYAPKPPITFTEIEPLESEWQFKSLTIEVKVRTLSLSVTCVVSEIWHPLESTTVT